MEYIIYIDESGSITYKKEEPFLVTLVLIDEDNIKRIKKRFKCKVNNIKKKIGISKKTELKATDLNKDNWKRQEFSKLIGWVEQENSIGVYGCYLLSGKSLENTKWVNDKNLTFNFLLYLALERLLDESVVTREDSLNLLVDNRNTKHGSLNSLEEYLKIKLTMEENKISKVKVEYMESADNWGVQLADFVCNSRWKKIKNGIKNIKNIRKFHI